MVPVSLICLACLVKVCLCLYSDYIILHMYAIVKGFGDQFRNEFTRRSRYGDIFTDITVKQRGPPFRMGLFEEEKCASSRADHWHIAI